MKEMWVILTFLLWCFLGFVFSLLLLGVYDGRRLPNELPDEEARESNRKCNRSLMLKLALQGGLAVGFFWYLFVHGTFLISN
jgi:hypothetical protein